MILASSASSAAWVGAPAGWKMGAGGCGRALVCTACGVYSIQIAIYPIEHQRMQVDVQVRGKREMFSIVIHANPCDRKTRLLVSEVLDCS